MYNKSLHFYNRVSTDLDKRWVGVLCVLKTTRRHLTLLHMGLKKKLDFQVSKGELLQWMSKVPFRLIINDIQQVLGQLSFPLYIHIITERLESYLNMFMEFFPHKFIPKHSKHSMSEICW